MFTARPISTLSELVRVHPGAGLFSLVALSEVAALEMLFRVSR